MKNYKLTIQYDGTNYCGWQIQPNAVTVQQKIVDAIKILLKEDVNLIGSGRTDTGVHAFGQVANFRIEKEIDLFRFAYALNSILPDDISITKIDDVNKDFHSRFDALSRSYFYLFSEVKSPFYLRFSDDFKKLRKLDLKELNRISKTLIGEHDFTSFSRKNDEIKNKVCNVKSIRWHKKGSLVFFNIEANRFLHGMVRTVLGTLLESAKNNYNTDYLLDVTKKKDRSAAAISVPAKGLFLYKVKY
ncbi:MAG: tRNA pseudouridine(38-40) synthase TruA [Melioribacteraceae bacterium]|nr:tRNA pseudouridine(38-40) synthase TruA [Melioribacteraceae bacterium]